MGRRPCCDKANVKRGPWSSEEDEILKNYVHTFGTGGNWIALPKNAGLKRCGKSCRLRWLNYLRPDIRHGDFTEEEDNIICSLYNEIGSRWSIIASKLSGRTDNEVKNYWNTKLKKKLQARKISLNSKIAENNKNPSTNNYNNATTLNFQNNMPQPNKIQQVDHQIIFNQSKFQPQPSNPPQLYASTDPWHGSLVNNNSVCDFSGCYRPRRFNFVEMEPYASSSPEINGNNSMSTTSSSSISNSPSPGVDNNIISSLLRGGTIHECFNSNISMDFGSGEFSWDMVDEFLLGEGSSVSK